MDLARLCRSLKSRLCGISMIQRFLAIAGAVLIVIGSTAVAPAHEGHDHGAPPPPVSATVAPRADASSAEFEIVAIARGETLQIFLDTFRGNEPVTEAAIEIDTPSGLVKAESAGDGSFVASAPFLAKPGAYDLAITVLTADMVDVLTATLEVPEPDPSAQKEEGGLSSTDAIATYLPEGLGSAMVGTLLPTILAGIVALIAGIAIGWIAKGRGGHAALVMMAAAGLCLPPAGGMAETGTEGPKAVLRDLAQRSPDGALFVPKPAQRIMAIRTLFTQEEAFNLTIEMPGRIIPDPNGSGLVQASVAGRLVPPSGGFPMLGSAVKKGDVLALVEPAMNAADAVSQQQDSRALDQEITLVERKLQRLVRLEGIVTRAQVEDLELELAGLRERRANLEIAPDEPEALVAPVDGVVADARAVAGQIADPSAVIFRIVDPSRLWVEALTYEVRDIGAVATARLPDSQTLELRYQGAGLADRSQAVPVQFSIARAGQGLRTGQLLTVFAKAEGQRKGIAVPRESVLRGPNGQSIVFEHANAERFVPREVRTEPLDSERLLIVSGIEVGKRIVTQGAELLNQIR